MKWTNRGHELDEIGTKFIFKKRLFIWGIGEFGKRAIGLLNWLKIEEDLSLFIVDSDSSLHETQYENIKIISPDVFFENYNEITDVLTFSSENVFQLVKEDGKYIIPDEFFICYAEKLPNSDFARMFLMIFLMYKRKELLSFHTNYIITTRCNLNCKGCLNFNEYIQRPADETFENFKKHIDTVFSKFDYLASFHFSGGEVMLHSEFPIFLEYIVKTYGSRIYEIFFVANGTVIPDKKLLEMMKKYNCGVLLDNYSHSVPLAAKNYPIIKSLFDKYQISYNVAEAEYWYDLKITDDPEQGANFTEADLIKIHDECGVHYFHDFYDEKIFGCCYIGYTNDMYSNKAGIYTPDPQNDFISIKDSSKMEILEYRVGYLQKGYFELCRRCSEMHGKKSVHIPVAEQLTSKRGER